MTVAGAYAQAPAAAPLPTVDDIIAKNLQAKGGAAKWQSMKSVKMTGKMTAQGTEMPLTVYAMRPNFNRQEITMAAGKAIQVYHLKVTTKGGPVQHYLLDADSGIELQMSAEVELGNGQKQTLTTAMSNYKQVDGIMIPHTVTQTAGGRTLLQWTITTVEFNAVPDDSIFRLPKK